MTDERFVTAELSMNMKPCEVMVRPSPVGKLCLAMFALCGALFVGGAARAQTNGLGPRTLTNQVGMTLQRVAPNHYERGSRRRDDLQQDHQQVPPSDDARPIHPVIITRPFYIGRHEVTVQQFRQFVEATGYRTTAEDSKQGMVVWDTTPDPKHPDAKMSFRQSPQGNWRAPGFPQQDDHPVTGVSYKDAAAYCQWLSKREQAKYRLPTEAEWECAARAGTTTSFSFGDEYRGAIHQHANIGNVELERAAEDRVLQQWLVDVERDPPDKHVFTAPVGSYQPNGWGLCDMHGNVWEWCADQYLDTAYAPFKGDGYQRFRRRAIDPLNEKPWNQYGQWRVIRGGSWFNAPALCRSGTRAFFEAGDAACYLGFRVVRECHPALAAKADDAHRASEQALTELRKTVNVLERRNGRLHVELTPEQLTSELLAVLQKLQYATDLHLRGAVTREQIQAVSEIPRLAGFVLAGGARDLTAEDFMPLSKHSLEVLQITGLGDLDNSLLAHFSSCANLESLQLQGQGITDQGIRENLPPLSKLHTLHVSSTQCEGACLAHFAGAPLTQVSFGSLTDVGARHLRPFHETLRRLTVNGSPLTGKGIAEIATLRRLQSLRAEECDQVSDEEWTVLGNLRQLRDVHLRETKAGDKTLAALAPLNRLEEVSIGGVLTDVGLNSLCTMISLRRLRIDAADRISDDGFEFFWRLQNLRSFELEAAQVAGVSWGAVAELPKLDSLAVASDDFSDAGLIALAKSKSLQRLTVTGAADSAPVKVTDVGVAALAEMPMLKQLTLQRQASQVTEDAVKTLQQQSSVRVSVR